MNLISFFQLLLTEKRQQYKDEDTMSHWEEPPSHTQIECLMGAFWCAFLLYHRKFSAIILLQR